MNRDTPTYRSYKLLLALVVIALGLLIMIRSFSQSQFMLIAGQDDQLTKTALSVDNNIRGHFNWYCSDLVYITSREKFQEAETLWLETGKAEALLEHLQENPLTQTGLIDSMLVVAEGRSVLTTGENVDYTFMTRLGKVLGVEIYLCEDPAGQVYVALLQKGEAADYAALIEGETFFSIAETQSAAEKQDRILLLDTSGKYFFHRTAEGVRIDRVDSMRGEEHPGLRQLQEVQKAGEQQATFYRSGGVPDQEKYTVRMVALPNSNNANGCFTIGLAHNYDESIRPFRSMAIQMAVSSAIVVAGIALLLAFLFRFHRYNQQAQEELILLRAKTQAMEQLNQQTQELAHHQRLETIGTLTSSIAHEFNNLLTPIMGYSILVLERLPAEDTESYDNMLEIYYASRKAKEIISRLSDLSRKNTAAALQELSPDELVQRALTVAAPARPKNVEIETDLNCQGMTLYGNETQISQMLLNLIINSFQAMESGGGTLFVSTFAGEGRVVFQIEDTGPGIPPEVQEKMFEPFFTTKETGKGTGLGLAIVRQVVEDCSGTIEVISAPGQGARFTVSVPFHPEEKDASAEDAGTILKESD